MPCAGLIEFDDELRDFGCVGKEEPRETFVLMRPVKFRIDPMRIGRDELGSLEAESIDEREVAGLEDVRELLALHGRQIEEAVFEQEARAATDIVVGAADQPFDLVLSEETKARDIAGD